MSPSPTPFVVIGRSGSTEWLSILIAVFAFVVALLTLYLSNLKRARIELIPLRERHRVIGSGFVVANGQQFVEMAYISDCHCLPTTPVPEHCFLFRFAQRS